MAPRRAGRNPGAVGHRLLLVLLAAFFLTLLVIPLSLLLSSAFQRVDLSTFQTTDRFTLHQFVRFFSDEYYLELLVRTVRIAGQTTVLCLLIGYPVALHMWQASPRERQILRLIVLSPLLISFVILNFGWLIILAPQGLINNLLLATGLSRTRLSLLYSEGAVVVGLVHIHLPFMILSIENALETLSTDVVKAGRSLGADRWRLMRHVIWPLSIGGVVSGSVIVFATTASSFVTPVLLGGAWVKTLASVAYQQIVVNLDVPFGSAIAIILLMLTAIVTFVLVRMADRLQPHLAADRNARPAPEPAP